MKEETNIDFPEFIEYNYLFDNKEDLLPGDKLTLRCEIFLDKIEEYYEKIEKGRVEDFDDFGMLLFNEKLSDVTISVSDDNRKFHAHKYVLAKKSEVFAAMFAHDMLENENNLVNIEDVPYKTMKSMLLYYIYIGKLLIFDIPHSEYINWIEAMEKINSFESIKNSMNLGETSSFKMIETLCLDLRKAFKAAKHQTLRLETLGGGGMKDIFQLLARSLEENLTGSTYIDLIKAVDKYQILRLKKREYIIFFYIIPSGSDQCFCIEGQKL